MHKIKNTYHSKIHSIGLSTLLILLPFLLFSQIEICDNGIDDDNDNLIDFNDDDCICDLISTVSLIPNSSFEEMACCPKEPGQLNCAAQWIQASEPTTDFIHSCDWLGWDEYPPPMPFPDGLGIMGFRDGRVRGPNIDPEPFWKEYAGACLTKPLRAGKTYRFQFDVGFVNAQISPPIDISFFGTSDCQYLPFGKDDIAFGCPSKSPNWKSLGNILVDGGTSSKWVNSAVEITPAVDIHAIAIGPACAPVRTDINSYYFFDNLILADFESFNLRISGINHPCSEDYILSIPYNPDLEYQWYKEGIALVGETFSELSQSYGEGSYTVRIFDGTSCRISSPYEYLKPIINTESFVDICIGDYYDFGDERLYEQGVYLDTLKSFYNCDSIVHLTLETIGLHYDTIEVDYLRDETFIFENNSFDREGNYPFAIKSSIGCDSLIYLKLKHFDIYFPNIFSPRDLSPNNSFKVFAEDGRVQSVNIFIYDRWGNLLYEGEEWDGSDVKTGVYTYAANLELEFGEPVVVYGTVTLLR